MPIMTGEQRAMQVWSVLVMAARSQEILSYTTLGGLIGMPAFALAPILGRIEAYCERRGYPHLTAIVVSQATGIPGHLFPGFRAEELSPEAEVDPIVAETGAQSLNPMIVLCDQGRTFVFDWLSAGVPWADDEMIKV